MFLINTLHLLLLKWKLLSNTDLTKPFYVSLFPSSRTSTAIITWCVPHDKPFIKALPTVFFPPQYQLVHDLSLHEDIGPLTFFVAILHKYNK